jgi:hypothetical protein
MGSVSGRTVGVIGRNRHAASEASKETQEVSMWFVLVVGGGGGVGDAGRRGGGDRRAPCRGGRRCPPPRIPSSAYERALGGALVASVDTGSGAVGAAWGVVAMNEPIERVWMAVNDEVGLERHLPTQTAAVLVGSDHGAPRTLYEYLPLPVVQDRWWVVEVEHSEGAVPRLRWAVVGAELA